MLNPGTTLTIGVLVIAFTVWVFWPRRGIIALLNRLRRNTQRIRIEDTLKVVFDFEYKNQVCGMHSVAGHLGISVEKVARLLDRLRSMGLIEMRDQVIKLTDTGRSYALRVIRVHRIWERYLADETGLSQMEWHDEADAREHMTTAAAANTLAAQMGNPVYDPHGDPIPSAEGEIPEHKGQPLSTLREGDIARIVHIEDEPAFIYEQLVAEGLYPGMQVYVLDVDNGKITFAAGGEECVLTQLFATAITVEVITDKEPLEKKHKVLSSLALGETAEVAGISPKCRGQQRRRLMDLGIVPGTIVTATMRSASGDPTGYRVMGTTIGIRKDQADAIYIKEVTENKHEPV